MTRITWNKPGERLYQTGVDRGVLYPPPLCPGDNSVGVPWNGLVSVESGSENNTSTPLYFDGQKRIDLVKPGDFSATIKAFTYPDEFTGLSGFSEFTEGFLLDNQPRNTFGLSYRTLLGNDLAGSDLGYKIHVLYNLTALPDVVGHQTADTNVAPITFSWKITGVPEEVVYHRPTVHFTIDSTKVHPEALSYIEDILYGTQYEAPRLITLTELLIDTAITIVDNGDGTWTATGPSYLIDMLDVDTFEIDGAYIITSSIDGYTIASTYDPHVC